jgi:hypothetical protein
MEKRLVWMNADSELACRRAYRAAIPCEMTASYTDKQESTDTLITLTCEGACTLKSIQLLANVISAIG